MAAPTPTASPPRIATGLEDMPVDIWFHLHEHLDHHDLVALAATSHTCRILAHHLPVKLETLGCPEATLVTAMRAWANMRVRWFRCYRSQDRLPAFVRNVLVPFGVGLWWHNPGTDTEGGDAAGAGVVPLLPLTLEAPTASWDQSHPFLQTIQGLRRVKLSSARPVDVAAFPESLQSLALETSTRKGPFFTATQPMPNLTDLSLTLHMGHSSAATLPSTESWGRLRWLKHLTLVAKHTELEWGGVALLGNLTQLTVTLGSRSGIPAAVWALPRLERVEVSGPSIANLYPTPAATPGTDAPAWTSGVRELVIACAPRLSALPTDFGSRLPELAVLTMRGTCLWALPASIGLLSGLVRLVVVGSGARPSLPPEASSLHALEHLELSAGKLETVPACLDDMVSLRTAIFRNAGASRVAARLSGLANLTRLDLGGCRVLCSLPASLGACKGLRWLSVARTRIQSLPALAGLSHLEHLDARLCVSLQSMGDLSGLARLATIDLEGCTALRRLPDVMETPQLVTLALGHCSSLVTLPAAVGELAHLERFDLTSCRALLSLPEGVASLPRLASLKLRHCHQLEGLGDEERDRPGSLEHLDITGCSMLASVGDSLFARGAASVKLRAANCPRLTSLPASFGRWRGLTHLDLSDCVALQALPDAITGLRSVVHARLAGCSALECLPRQLGKLARLQTLDLTNCTALTALPPSTARLLDLEVLVLNGCKSLLGLPAATGDLVSLQTLSMYACAAVTELPDSLGELPDLTVLELTGCRALAALPDSVGRLSSLHALYLDDCASLRGLPSWLAGLGALQILKLDRGHMLPASLPLLARRALAASVPARFKWLASPARDFVLARALWLS